MKLKDREGLVNANRTNLCGPVIYLILQFSETRVNLTQKVRFKSQKKEVSLKRGCFGMASLEERDSMSYRQILRLPDSRRYQTLDANY